MILNEKPLEEFRRRAEEISNLLSVAIGPFGRNVIINNSGTIIITKSSLDIISVFDQKICPERDFIIDCMKNLDREIGDGSKSFILMLSTLLLHSEEYSRDYLTRQCTIFLNFLFNINSTVNEGFHFSKIISTFFSTRFPIHVSSFLAALFKEWVENNNNTLSGNIYQNLLSYFDALVTVEEKCTPLTESRTVDGLCVNGHFHGQLPKCDKLIKLIVIYMSEENDGSEHDLNTHVKEISSVLNSLNDYNILIITNCILPSVSLQLLSKYHLITHVASEKVHLLHNYVVLHKNKTGCYPEVKVFNFCNYFRTDLIIMIPFSHLILFAPSKTLSNSYIGSFKSCLKLCSYALANKSLLIECVKFEKLLSINLLKNANSSNIIYKGEQDFLDIHCSDYLLNLKLEKLNIDNKKMDITDELVNEIINSKLPLLERDATSVIIKMLNEYILKVSSCDNKGFEPLKLKIDVLIRVFRTFLSIIRIDKVLKVKKS